MPITHSGTALQSNLLTNFRLGCSLVNQQWWPLQKKKRGGVLLLTKKNASTSAGEPGIARTFSLVRTYMAPESQRSGLLQRLQTTLVSGPETTLLLVQEQEELNAENSAFGARRNRYKRCRI